MSRTFDSWLVSADNALRTLTGGAHAARPSPAEGLEVSAALTTALKQRSGPLMRVNHVGEVCAQALYEAQALTARSPKLQAQMRHAAQELGGGVQAFPLGMLAAAKLLTLLSEHGVSLLMAFVAGSLLHLVTGHLLPEVTGHHHDLDAHDEQYHRQVAPFLIMLGGFSTLLISRLLSPS